MPLQLVDGASIPAPAFSSIRKEGDKHGKEKEL